MAYHVVADLELRRRDQGQRDWVIVSQAAGY